MDIKSYLPSLLWDSGARSGLELDLFLLIRKSAAGSQPKQRWLQGLRPRVFDSHPC